MEPAKRVVGEVSATNFPTILMRAGQRAPRGVLAIASAGVERKIYLREKLILFASTTDPAEYLAERAVRSGVITQEQVRQALEESVTGRRIGSTLVRLGFLTEEKLVELLLEQIRAIVTDCFAATSGSYTLSIGDLPSQEPITLDEPVTTAIARELRKVRSIERLRESAGEPTTGYFPVKGWQARLDAGGFSRDEPLAEVAELVASSPGITVRNLVVSLPRSETDLLQTLWILRALEIVGTPPEKKPAAAKGEETGEKGASGTISQRLAALRFAEALEKEAASKASSAAGGTAEPAPRAAKAPPSPPQQATNPEDSVLEIPEEIVARAVDPPLADEPAEAGGIDLENFDFDTELDLGGVFLDDSGSAPSTVVPPPPPRVEVKTSEARGEDRPSDPSSLLERALTAAEDEVELALALGHEKAASSGTFRTTPFADVLVGLSRSRSTGTLIGKRNDEERTVTLDRGRPIFATTNVRAERITNRLVSEGILTTADLVKLTEFWPNARRVGGVILALRLVEPDVLRQAIRRQVADIIASLYDWDDGGYFFQERANASPEEIITDLSLPELALRGAGAIGDPERLLAAIGGDDQRLRVAEDPSSLFQGISLTPDQREFVGRLGKGGKVRDLAALGPVPRTSAIVVLYTLLASGFLERGGKERISSPVIPDPERLLASAGSAPDAPTKEEAASELARRLAEISTLTDASILGVAPGAPEAAVAAAFESIAPRFHPDRFRAFADPALLRLAGRVFDRHVLAFFRILNPPPAAGAAPKSVTLEATEEPAPIPRSTVVKTRVRTPPPAMTTGLVLEGDPKSGRELSQALLELGFAPEVAPSATVLRRILGTPGRRIGVALVDVELLESLDPENLELLGAACRADGVRSFGTYRTGGGETTERCAEIGLEGLLEKNLPGERLRALLRERLAAER